MRLFLTFALTFLIGAAGGALTAAEYVFDVSGGNGTVTMGGNQVSSLNGVPFTFQVLPNGIGQFEFRGDLTFAADDMVSGTGDAPISIYGLSNITIESGATFDVSATASAAGPGGGAVRGHRRCRRRWGEWRCGRPALDADRTTVERWRTRWQWRRVQPDFWRLLRRGRRKWF